MLAITIYLLFRSYFAGPIPSNEFTLVKETSGVKLYERWISENGNNRRELKAVFQLRSDLSTILPLLQEQQKASQWMQNTKVVSIEKKSGSEWISYVHYKLPWPLPDQDCCLMYTLYGTGSTYTLSFNTTHNKNFPEKKNVERMQGTSGKWVFTGNVNQVLTVEYYVSTEPKSNIPRAIADPFIYKNIIATMSSFRTMAEKK